MRAGLALGLLVLAAVIAVLVWRPWETPAVDTGGARVVEYAVDSDLLGRSLDQVAVVPRGEGPRPLLVLLHGHGSEPEQWLSDQLFAELERLGPNAPAVALVSGEESYYHDRRDGPWGSYVLEEAIPAALERTGADPRRVAIGGISMGGFGALDLARLAPRRFCAVGGHSPALWRTGGETPEGAFDDAEDFARHDLFEAAASGKPFGRGVVWLDTGRSDPFLDATRGLARELRRAGTPVRLRIWPGGHQGEYGRQHTPDYLRFYARRLSACR
jgi:enterochelin esterase-like enzyme